MYMEGNFNDFPEIPNVDVESVDKAKGKSEDTKKVLKRLSKLMKKLHKQNKLLWQLSRHNVHTAVKEPAVEEPVQNQASTAHKNNHDTNTTVKREKSFMEKVGDVFLKALPSILCTVAAVAVPLLFGFSPRGYAPLRRAVT